MSEKICSFEPVADERSRLLILGTMPSVKSLDEGFYYAHPRNAFWPMMAELLGCARPNSIDQKKRLLLDHGIALWDVARSCVREGSLDADMKEIELNDFTSFFEHYPRIGCVLLNGGMAGRLYRRLPKEIVTSRSFYVLPSTSPAYTLSYEKKKELWRTALTEYER